MRLHAMARIGVLAWILIAVFAITTPIAVHRIIKTGDLYLFTERFFRDMLARLSGPGRFRFVLQPTVATILGIRGGIRDAYRGKPPFITAIFFLRSHRTAALGEAAAQVRNLVIVSILLDIASQILIFREVHPAAALLLGPVLIGTPYAVSRALGNRISRSRARHASATPVG